MRRILLVTIFIVSSISVAAACTCYSEPHGKTSRQAEAIFVGTLVSIGTQEISNQKISGGPLHSLTFKVERKWKGIKTDEITVFTNAPNSCSAFEFREGRKYLIYVRNNSFVTSDCASSVEADSSAARDRMKDLNSFWFRLKARLLRI